MSIVHLLFKEIGRRKLNFLLALSAVSIAMGLFVWLVASSSVNEAAARKMEDATRKMGLKMGYNLVILPKSLDLNQYYHQLDILADHDMPEDYVVQIAKMNGSW